jgi:hypothetical protein
MNKVFAPLRFLCHALRGHWLRPWRSPYLRWRIETYSGIPANRINARIFWKFLFQERARLLHFLVWTAEMSTYQNMK